MGTKIFGAALIPASFIAAYFWILEPLREGVRSGTMQYNLKGVLLPPALLYLGVCLLVADMRDGQVRITNADGTKTWTPKGRKFLVGLVAVLGLALLGWFLCLRSAGFSMF